MTDVAVEPSPSGRLHRAAVQRHARKQAFVDFRASAEGRFGTLAPKVAHWTEYADHYHAHFLPGGWDGGTDPDRFDVIFGNRIVDSTTNPAGKGLAFQSERGAWLSYQRQLGGQVMVFLYAARLSIESRDPEPLVLDVVSDASKLTDARLQSHLRDLVAFMAATILDDARTVPQRARALWLRWVKPSVSQAGGVWGIKPPRWVSAVAAGAHWVGAVGLSGALLFGIQRFFPGDTSPSAEQLQLNARIETALDDSAALRLLLQRDIDANRRLRASIEADLAQLRAEKQLAEADRPSPSPP